MTLPSSDHFKGKNAVDHVVEAQARGIIASSEIHGTEIPGSISAATDAARETLVFLVLSFFLLDSFTENLFQIISLLVVIGFALLIWKGGRSAWLAWSRLERLHRILEEERFEIEHNRSQEREELKALYQAKGFEGKLLEEVLDVLMSDGDRLLKVMIEEELGLSLEVYEHPLKQCLGAALGVFVTTLILIAGLWFWPIKGIYLAAFFVSVISSYLSAIYQGNRLIAAIIWNLGITGLTLGAALFLFEFIKL